LTNKQVKKLLRENYPESEGGAAYISWCRTFIRKTEPDVPTDAEARKRQGL
jgi:hypothetical protein